MTINVLVFELKECEKNFFDNNHFQDMKITFFAESLNEQSLKTLSDEFLENTNVISVINDSSITGDIINKFKNLRVISVRDREYDHICINTCEERNIALINIQDEGVLSVAQFTIGLIINLVRNIIPANGAIELKEDSGYEYVGRELSNLTLGIIGTGFVGAELCKLSNAAEIKTIAYDINPKQELADKYGLKYVSLKELAKQSDIVSVNLDYLPEYYHLCNEEFFSDCKDGFYFISTSKSEIIDYKALDKYIENGKIKGAALDALPCKYMCKECEEFSEKIEPLYLECLAQTDYLNKYKKYDNVIITPHIAHLTQDAVDSALKKTFVNIKEALKGDKMCRII